MKKKFLLFDFDGTIANTLPAIITSLKKVAKEFDYDISTRDILKLRKMTPLEIVTHLKFPPWKIPKLISRIREELAKNVDKIKIINGMEQAILDLKFKGYRMGILTSNLKETVEKFLIKNKLLVFDQIVSEPGIFRKSKSLKKILHDRHLNTTDVIYLGDEVRDIDFCRQSGIKIISVTWGFNKKEVLIKNKPDFLAEKPQDIKEILKNLK